MTVKNLDEMQLSAEQRSKIDAYLSTEPDTLVRMLDRAANLLTGRMLEVFAARSGIAISASQIAVLRQICRGQNTLTSIARSLGHTKQAVGQLADGMESAGLLRREVDPLDRRSKRLLLTEWGDAVMYGMFDLTIQLEDEVRLELGEQEMDRLKAALALIETKMQNAGD